MSNHTTLPAPFRQEATTLPVMIPNAFERFYRETLRRVVGSRIKSRALGEAYDAWAAKSGEGKITFARMRQLMELVGHRRIQSNGISYVDVGFAADFPGVGDTLEVAPGGLVSRPTQPRSVEGVVDVDTLGLVDAALASLLDLRRHLVARAEREHPARAAERVLGLFDR